MSDSTATAPWHLVIPVKGGSGAKTRLRAPDGVDHASLAIAFAVDTITAAVRALSAARVLVVTSGTGMRARLPEGVRVVTDPGFGLNSAVRAGLGALEQAGHDSWTAVLLGDLPALRAADLYIALGASLQLPRSFVPDRAGSGTVLLSGPHPGAIEPSFGHGSAGRHEDAGYHRLELSLPHLRTDVDDEDSLGAVLELGVGCHTARLMADLLRTASSRANERPA